MTCRDGGEEGSRGMDGGTQGWRCKMDGRRNRGMEAMWVGGAGWMEGETRGTEATWVGGAE
eukprot:2192556-Prorocentrum_lima.AAC.1